MTCSAKHGRKEYPVLTQAQVVQPMSGRLILDNQKWEPLNDMTSSSLSAGQGFLTWVFQDIDFDGDSDLPITLSVAGSSTTGDVTIGSIPSGDYYLAENPYPKL
ncbi:MAG: hypothetical protein CM15mP87_02940 [Candidatus Neomarinimicrobiota bacterium]|nr:MAG: hypothetical protein CM15mP87_02940 [Candidatus Neomarinimicrobiota bacterium]